jgi:hypothetical protein
MKTSSIVKDKESSSTFQQTYFDYFKRVDENIFLKHHEITDLSCPSILDVNEVWRLLSASNAEYWAKKCCEAAVPSIQLLNSNLPLTCEECLEIASAIRRIISVVGEKASWEELYYLSSLVEVLDSVEPAHAKPAKCQVVGCKANASEIVLFCHEEMGLCSRHAKMVKDRTIEMPGS